MDNFKTVNVVFVDDLPNLTKDQINTFRNTLMDMKDNGSERERELLLDISISNLREESFLIRVNDFTTMNVYGETLMLNRSIDGKLSSPSIDKIKKMVDKYNEKRTLFVIDLCLDEINKNDSELGVLLWKEIQKINQNCEVLFMSGNINLWHHRDTTSDDWFVYRATIEDRMNPRFAATSINQYFTIVSKEVSEDNRMFGLLRYLLSSKYNNRQYFGVVLLKSYLMLNRISEEEK